MTDYQPEETATGETSRRNFMKSGALATGALAIGTGAVVAQDSGENGGDDQEADTSFANVQFANQESDGSEVVVESTTLSEPGYVAFHDATLFEGQVLESVIGVTERLDAGASYETEADLFDVAGADFEVDELQGTAGLVAMPHRETGGNDSYDFVSSGGEEDGPFAEAGLPVVDFGFVSVDDGGSSDMGATDSGNEHTPTPTETGAEETDDEETETEETDDEETEAEETDDEETETEETDEGAAPFASVDFQNQTLDGDTVTVGEAVLSDGGFVTLHDARLLSGDAIGSVVGVSDYLEPGVHRSIEVALDDPDAVAEVPFPPAPTVPIIPMPHRDTNDNEEYDFVTSEGAEDGPYTKAGQAVVDLGFVLREEAETGTATPTATETPE